MKKDYILPASILIAGILIAGSVIYSTGLKNMGGNITESNQNSDPTVSLELNKEDVVLGEMAAPITLIEYADLQCPFCNRFYLQSEKQIREDLIKTGKAKMVFRHFSFLGDESIAAAGAVECAKDQGKFWEFRDAVYEEEIRDEKENNGNLNTILFNSIAKNLGMDVSVFSDCVAKNKYSEKVKSDYDNGVVAGVNSTPTLFVNGKKVEGALPYNQLSLILDSFLK